jgi:hypothetical protein
LFTYQVPGNILFDVNAIGGIFTIYLNEVATPYMIANKGALVSEDTAGKIKIEADGTMSVSREIGVNGASRVSINRPDLWTPGIEYDFGNGLFGQRFIGTVTQAGGTNMDTTLISSGVSIPHGFGGWWAHANLNKAVANGSFGGGTYNSGVYVSTAGLMAMLTRDPGQRTNAPYDVWVTYGK